ncbi:MAG: hypothetical protein M0P13_01520 [Fibrobacteraceae bacterium]|nr:hypothetical protein [Fibrobacteraceae bacterium]
MIRVQTISFVCIAASLLAFAACASQRQKPVCAEIEYRLDHMAYSPDQRAWQEDELRQCKAEQEEYEKSDSITNKFKKSIYEMYEESKKDSSKGSSTSSSASEFLDPTDSVARDSLGQDESIPSESFDNSARESGDQ